MKQNIFRKAILGLAMVAGFALTVQPGLAQAPGQIITGTWLSTGNARACTGDQSYGTLLGLDTYLQDGAMFHTDNIPTAGGADGSLPPQAPGHGSWKRIAGNTFTNSWLKFTFGPQGTTWFGINWITRTITLNPDHQSYTAETVVKVRDANGNLVATACVSEVAQRVPDSF